MAVDGSDVSLSAVRSLLSHIQWFREPPEVHLLYVCPPVPVGLALQHLSRETLDRHYREEAGSMLEPAGDLFRTAGIEPEVHIHIGDAAKTIVALSSELNCELICMGSHGRGMIGSALLGSVASRVLHLASVSVLLAR